MKLVFISNTFGHYQIPLCEEWNRLCDFRFITTKPMSDAQKKLGFTDWAQVYPYVTNAWENEVSRNEALKLCLEADVVVAGACDEFYLKERFGANKLTFRFTERLFKKGKKSLLKPKNFLELFKKHTSNRRKNYYVLCAGADCASDFRFIGMKKEKLLRWGYFPEVPALDMDQVLLDRGDSPVRIVWVGRLVELKHPDRAILAARFLKDKGLNFVMELIGMGPLEEKLRLMIHEQKLEDRVLLLGSLPSQKVREKMQSSHIFLLNSDKREGWGAVVSEAMGSGCAAVVADEAGAARVLIRNGETGIYYPVHNQEALNEALCTMVSDRDLREKVSRGGYELMWEMWNGSNAARRILSFSEAILQNREPPKYTSGPVSYACEEQR